MFSLVACVYVSVVGRLIDLWLPLPDAGRGKLFGVSNKYVSISAFIVCCLHSELKADRCLPSKLEMAFHPG